MNNISFGTKIESASIGEVPETITITDTEIQVTWVFRWNEADGSFITDTGVALYIEPVNEYGEVSEESYWEFEDFAGYYTSND